MSPVQPHHLLAAYIAVGTLLLALWMQGGFALVLVAAALTDLGLTIVERRRTRMTSPARIRRG